VRPGPGGRLRKILPRSASSLLASYHGAPQIFEASASAAESDQPGLQGHHQPFRRPEPGRSGRATLAFMQGYPELKPQSKVGVHRASSIQHPAEKIHLNSPEMARPCMRRSLPGPGYETTSPLPHPARHRPVTARADLLN